MPAAATSRRKGSNFFLRSFAVLLTLTVGISSILMFVGYSFSRSSIEKRTKENIHQQVEVIRDRFDAEYRTNLNRSLRSLVNDPILDDYLRASEEEQMLIRGKIQSKFRQVLRDFDSYRRIVFMGTDGNVEISMKRDARAYGVFRLGSGPSAEANPPAQKLFWQLEATPLLLSSGNMEWFMPPREIQIQGPFVSKDNLIHAVAGIAKLDLDTGGFGGVVMIHQVFDVFFADLRNVRFFDVNPLWVFSPEGEILQRPDAGGQPFGLGERLPDGLQSRTLMTISDDGLVAFTDFSIVPGEAFFRLMIEIPRSLLLKDLYPAIQFFTVVLIISLVVLLFLSLYVSRFLSKPFFELQTTEGRLAKAQKIARLGHWEYDTAADRLTLSEQAREILGSDQRCEAITSSDLFQLADPSSGTLFEKHFQAAVAGGAGFSVETVLSGRGGSERVLHHEIVVENGSSGRNRRIVGTIQDITERKETEQKIRHLAYYDDVTGLPNRSLLNEHGERAIASTFEDGTHAAILFLDLDHFKKVNDTFGHSAGDELLRQVSDRLRQCLRQSDTIGSLRSESDPPRRPKPGSNTVARLGGDEFIVLLSQLKEIADAGVVAQRIIEAIAKRFVVNEKTIYTSCSIGISLCPRDGATTEDLMQYADAAMYLAKTSGRNQYKYYTPAISERVHTRISMETQLHKAVEERQFHVLYQPRINIRNGDPVAIEALIRWVHPEQGLMKPEQFIPIAEDTGLIVPIGEYVLETACRHVKTLHDRGFPHMNVSVNISAAQFNKELVRATTRILRDTGLDARFLELELTESLLIGNIDACAGLLSELKALGLGLSIDDFGKGYSSLSLLKHLPVDTLKIDKSFTVDILTDPGDALIVKSTIELGHNLRLKVVAEGVELTEQLEFLYRHRCDEGQGFLFSKPLQPDEVARWLETTEFKLPARDIA